MTAKGKAPTILAWLSLAVMALILLIAALAFPQIQSTAENVRAQERSDQIAACARQIRIPIDAADSRLERAETARDDLILAGLVAAVTNNTAQLDQIIETVPLTRVRVAKAQTAKDDAVAEYQEAADLISKDPDLFLEQCGVD